VLVFATSLREKKKLKKQNTKTEQNETRRNGTKQATANATKPKTPLT